MTTHYHRRRWMDVTVMSGVIEFQLVADSVWVVVAFLYSDDFINQCQVKF